VFYVVPVVATLGGWALLAEAIAPTAVAGFLTIFAGFAVLGSESVDLAAIRQRLTGETGQSVHEEATNGFGSGSGSD
jgi:hypothetical protein